MGVAKNTIRRWTDESYLERNRTQSREYKTRQGKGTCIDCGKETGISGKYPKGHPLYYALRCSECSIIDQRENVWKPRRGTGDRAKKIFTYLEENGPSYFSQIRDHLGWDSNNTSVELDRQRRYGKIVRLSRGLYALPGQADEQMIPGWQGFDRGKR